MSWEIARIGPVYPGSPITPNALLALPPHGVCRPIDEHACCGRADGPNAWSPPATAACGGSVSPALTTTTRTPSLRRSCPLRPRPRNVSDGWWTEPRRPLRPPSVQKVIPILVPTRDPLGGLFNWDDD